MAVRDRLLRYDADRTAVAAIFHAFRFGPVGYLAAAALSFVSVTASVVLNLALAIYYALPSRTSRGHV